MDQMRDVYPEVLEFTGPHSDEQVLSHVYGIMQLPLQVSAERLQQKRAMRFW